MGTDILITGSVLAVLLILYSVMSASRRANLLNRRRKIEREWGNVPDREYISGELENIAHYYQNKLKRQEEKSHVIDDITWNDLDMDRVFCMLNRTYSSVGQEYLYYMLRTPEMSEENMQERERLIRHFAEAKTVRTELQMQYFEIGRTKKVSICDYIQTLESLRPKSNMPHYLSIFIFLLCAVGCFLNPAVGFLILLADIGVNIRVYYKQRGEIEPYIVTFVHLIRMLKAGEKISRIEDTEISSYINEIREIRKSFGAFQKKSVWIAGGDKMSGSALDVFTDYIRMLFHIDLIVFNQMLGEVQKKSREIYRLMDLLGMLEAHIAIASYRESLPFYVLPEFLKNQGTELEAEDVYHPMIREPVANTIRTKKGVLITGSNASGKSTFLKTIAINGILAQTIHTCLAHTYRTNFFRVYSSMALRDDLDSQESYYIVEIKSLKRILNETNREVPVLCFIDEVLRGTNTVERIAASAQILKSLAGNNVLCFAATHDIELTQMLEADYDNYHFQEEIVENDILFDYILYPGRATSRNAIRLLGMIGYDEEIIRRADATAEEFLKSGEWILAES